MSISSYHLPRSLADRWGTTVDFTTSFLHSSRFSAFRLMMFQSRPVHSLMLSSHRFFCLPLRLPPCTVPCRIVLTSPHDRLTCPYHFSEYTYFIYICFECYTFNIFQSGFYYVLSDIHSFQKFSSRM